MESSPANFHPHLIDFQGHTISDIAKAMRAAQDTVDLIIDLAVDKLNHPSAPWTEAEPRDSHGVRVYPLTGTEGSVGKLNSGQTVDRAHYEAGITRDNEDQNKLQNEKRKYLLTSFVRRWRSFVHNGNTPGSLNGIIERMDWSYSSCDLCSPTHFDYPACRGLPRDPGKDGPKEAGTKELATQNIEEGQDGDHVQMKSTTASFPSGDGGEITTGIGSSIALKSPLTDPDNGVAGGEQRKTKRKGWFRRLMRRARKLICCASGNGEECATNDHPAPSAIVQFQMCAVVTNAEGEEAQKNVPEFLNVLSTGQYEYLASCDTRSFTVKS